MVEAWFLQRPVRTWIIGSLGLATLLVAVSAATVRLGGLGLSGEGGIAWPLRLLGAGGRGHRSPRPVWVNPIAWREATTRNATPGRVMARWMFLGAGGVLAATLVLLHHRGSLSAVDFRLAVLTTVLGELAVTMLVTLHMAATCISREREDGTLDLLLTTPLTPRVYLSGKWRGLAAYTLPMLLVPVGTATLAGLYVLAGGVGRPETVTLQATVPGMTASVEVPAVLPETGLVVLLSSLPFLGFVAMVGLHWSLQSRGTLPSVVATLAVAGLTGGVVGLCGWNAGSSLAVVGAVLAGLNPASALYAAVHPGDALAGTIRATEGDLGVARALLLMGCVGGAVGHALVSWALHAGMVRNFDVTVRRLAGER